MIDIEELLRDSLRDAPTPDPLTADPVPFIDRRVRRVRRLLAAGAAAAVAIVVAGIAVPLALSSDGASQVRVPPVTGGPSPVPTRPTTPSLHTLVESGAIWVSTSDDGHLWYSADSAAGRHLVELNAAGAVLHQAPLKAPSSLVVAGNDVVWVVGGDEGGNVLSRLAAYSPTGDLLGTVDFPHDLLSYATQVHDDLYVVRSSHGRTFVDRVTGVGGRLVTASVAVPGAETVAATAAGNVWVSTGKSLVRIVDQGTTLHAAASVPWSGPILGTVAGGPDVDALWSYDGSRVVELTPARLGQGVSVAEGERIPVPSRPSWVVSTTARDVFVAMNDGPVEIFFFRGDQLGAGTASSIIEVAGGQINAMTADPGSGVDFVDNDGQLQRWDPRR